MEELKIEKSPELPEVPDDVSPHSLSKIETGKSVFSRSCSLSLSWTDVPPCTDHHQGQLFQAVSAERPPRCQVQGNLQQSVRFCGRANRVRVESRETRWSALLTLYSSLTFQFSRTYSPTSLYSLASPSSLITYLQRLTTTTPIQHVGYARVRTSHGENKEQKRRRFDGQNRQITLAKSKRIWTQ